MLLLIETIGIHVHVQARLTESLLLSSLWALYASPWDLEQNSILTLKLILHQLPIDHPAIWWYTIEVHISIHIIVLPSHLHACTCTNIKKKITIIICLFHIYSFSLHVDSHPLLHINTHVQGCTCTCMAPILATCTLICKHSCILYMYIDYISIYWYWYPWKSHAQIGYCQGLIDF